MQCPLHLPSLIILNIFEHLYPNHNPDLNAYERISRIAKAFGQRKVASAEKLE